MVIFGSNNKNGVHILLIKTIDNKCTIYWIKVLLFLLTSLIYFIFLCIKNPKKSTMKFTNILKVN